MLTTIIALALPLAALVQGAAVNFDTSLGAMNVFSDILVTKMSYYRSKSNAKPLLWDEAIAKKAGEYVGDCDMNYDYFFEYGQSVFNIGHADKSKIDLVNSTFLVPDHWYRQRVNYTITSDDYDDLQPFWPAWEYTQMVWKANTKVGCAWNPSACVVDKSQYPDSPVDTTQQILCLFSPGGNKWQGWAANVDRPNYDEPPMTASINIATITLPSKRDALYTPGDADMARLEAYRTLDLEDFLPGFTTTDIEVPAETASPTAALTSAVTAHTSVEKRSTPPVDTDAAWQTAVVQALNNWRARRGVTTKVAWDAGKVTIAQAYGVTDGKSCTWPLSQDAQALGAFNWAWWLTDENTSDFAKEFQAALHMWEVWGNGPSFIGSLWATWYDQLVSENTSSIGCWWSPLCTEGLSKPSYQLMCAAGDEGVPPRDTQNPDHLPNLASAA